MAYGRCVYPKFNRVKKKLPSPLSAEVDRQVDRICVNPHEGEEKRGDLSGVLIHKFRLAGQLYMIAYLVDHAEKTVTLLALGGHESFYRDLKRYMAM